MELHASRLKQYAPIIIAVLLVLAAVYVYSTSGNSQGSTVIPGQNNDASVQQAESTNAQLAANYNQGIFQAFGALAGLAGTENTNATQLTALESNNATSAANTITAANAQYQIAQLQAGVLTTQYNDALQAQQAQAAAQASNGFWSSLGSIFTGAAQLAPVFGLSAHRNAALPAGYAPTSSLPQLSGVPSGGPVWA